MDHIITKTPCNRPLLWRAPVSQIPPFFKFEIQPYLTPPPVLDRHCYSSYVDYHRCIKKKGEDYPACEYFRKTYKSLCPNSWVDRWNDQMEAGSFPGKI